MSFDYINRNYQLSVKKGSRIAYTGDKKMGRRLGTVTGTHGAHLMIRLDGDKNSFPFHPTWEIEHNPDKVP